MSISGAIEDFPLKDILQIIAFSRKSGTLGIKGDKGTGRIVFKMGAMVRAEAPSSRADFGALLVKMGVVSRETVDRALERQAREKAEGKLPIGQILLRSGSLDPQDIERVLQAQISMALRDLLSWTEGSFLFNVHKVDSPDSFGIGFEQLVLDHGLDVQQILLQVMKYFDDEEREQAAAPLPPPTLPRSEDIRVILNHEGGLFRELLKVRLEAEGLKVACCEEVERAVELAGDHRELGLFPVLLRPLDASIESAEKAAELLERRVGLAAHVPVVLLADQQTEAAKERAFSLGARHLLLKPRRVGGSDEEYVASINRFAIDVAFAIKGLLAEEGVSAQAGRTGGGAEEERNAAGAKVGAVPGSGLPRELAEFLGMLRSEDAASVTLKLLDLISRRFQRSILFHLRGGRMSVKGAFGQTRRGKEIHGLLRNLQVDVRQTPGFAASFEKARPRRLLVGPDIGQIPDLIGPPASGECLVIPILCHFRPVGAIYADTFDTGKPLGDLEIYRELCNRVSEILAEAVLRKRGKRYLAPGSETRALRRDRNQFG